MTPVKVTPAQNLAVVLDVLAFATAFVRFCGVLTAFAESDFEDDAVQHGRTFGVFQQDPRWWPSALLGTRAQAVAWLNAFREHMAAGRITEDMDPVLACWIVQRWAVPNGGKTWPDPGPEFQAEKTRERSETWNYARRLPAAASIIENRRLP